MQKNYIKPFNNFKNGIPLLGGMVDYTVIEVSNTKELRVINEASGGPWGGTTVDKNFHGLLKQIFGDDVMAAFEKEHREDFVMLMHEFEFKKRTISDGKDKVTFKIPISIATLYREKNGKSLKLAMIGDLSNKIDIRNDKLRVHVDIINQLFQEACNNIVDHTMHLLRKAECKGVKTLLLVGGFFCSDLLQNEIKKNFPKLNLINPENPESAVMEGAVLFGHNPKVVKTRVARYTYGIDSTKPFDPRVHPKEKKITYDGKECCIDVFDVHVKKGELLEVGVPGQKKKYIPAQAKQTAFGFPIYVSTEESPQFVTDPSCTNIGMVKIDIPDTEGGRDRAVFVQMSFGETELIVEVTDEKTGKSVVAQFSHAKRNVKKT